MGLLGDLLKGEVNWGGPPRPPGELFGDIKDVFTSDFFFGGFEPGERPAADELGTDPDDPDAILELLQQQMLPSLIEQAKAGQIDGQTLLTYANIAAGRASKAELLAFQSEALTNDFITRLARGEYDDPEDGMEALTSWANQIADVQKKQARLPGAGVDEEVTAEERLLAEYEAQQKRAAEMEELNFRRQGIMDFLGTVPISERFDLLNTLGQADPGIFELFLGPMGGTTQSSAAPTLSQRTQSAAQRNVNRFLKRNMVR